EADFRATGHNASWRSANVRLPPVHEFRPGKWTSTAAPAPERRWAMEADEACGSGAGRDHGHLIETDHFSAAASIRRAFSQSRRTVRSFRPSASATSFNVSPQK